MLVVLFRSVTSRPIALWSSTAISAVLLTGIIYFWTHRNAEPEIVATPENSR
jgi:hypothetical protein